MKVILMQDVSGLGKAGDVKEVATGHGRNYLLPKGLAVVATPSALKQLQVQHKAQEKREVQLVERASELVERLSGLTLTFQAKAGPTGRLYGSVTTADIAAALEQEAGVRLERRYILSDPLREVGEHTVSVRVARDTVAQVRVMVLAEGEELPPEQPEEADATEQETSEPGSDLLP